MIQMKIKNNNKLIISKMKKQILALVVGLISIASFAQKNELKAIDKAIKKGKFSEAKATIKTLEANEDAIESKYKSKYFYLKGAAYGKSNVEKAANAYEKLFEIEKAAGKSKYTKLAKPKLSELIKFVSEKGIKQYNSKDFVNATKNFALTFKLSPADTAFLFNAATSASQAKDYEKAIEYYKTLQKINYTGITTQYLAVNKKTKKEEDLGSKANRDFMMKTGKYTNPRDKSSKSKQSDIIKNIGYSYVNLGKPELAVEALQEARKADPKNINILLNQADMYIKLKRMDKFGELMQEAVKIDPTNPTLFYNLGVINSNENKLEEAKGFLKKAIELDPNYADAYLSFANVILKGEKAIIDEMNENLNNFKKYEALEVKQKDLYKEALPYLVKGDSLKRSFETVRTLVNIYDILEMEKEADALRPTYKKMKSEQ
mgnify:FL=1